MDRLGGHVALVRHLLLRPEEPQRDQGGDRPRARHACALRRRDGIPRRVRRRPVRERVARRSRRRAQAGRVRHARSGGRELRVRALERGRALPRDRHGQRLRAVDGVAGQREGDAGVDVGREPRPGHGRVGDLLSGRRHRGDRVRRLAPRSLRLARRVLRSSGRARGGPERRAVALSATVWWYGRSYFFIKLIRYSLLFWLPYYLETVLQYGAGEAGYFSTSFEIGGVCGTMALGALSDRLRGVPRSVLCAASLLGLAAALFAYTKVGGSSHAANFAVMALVGALLYGPDALLSGAAAQDLGGRQAAALAIGMINGLGSVGAVSQEFITRGVSHAFGWNAVFYVLLVSAVAAAALLAPTFRTPPKRAEP